jgi:hypothetical protein
VPSFLHAARTPERNTAPDMNQEQWQQVKTTVALAMKMPQAERGAIIDSGCGTDPDLRREVESLLATAAAADALPEARAALASADSSMVSVEDASLRSLLESSLGHQYEIVRPLGRGGMGWVYLARERSLERFVAIKVLRPELAIAHGHTERFRREARIAARLTHPGILGLHSFGEIGNLWYFVMTYVRGETLDEKIRREGFLPWVDAHRIFAEMADALECAHRNGVIHRDIKPANILLDSDSGRAILADFGISKTFGSADRLTATGAILGTPAYMSPEQVTGEPDIDERADIYSLGAVAYAMLTGREPFRGESGASTAYRRLVEDPSPVESIVPTVPSDLSAVVRKCMAREREQRWANAKSLREALENILAADRLPNVIRDVRSFGPYAFVWAIGWVAFAALSERLLSERVLMLLIAGIAPIGLGLHLWNGAGRGMRMVEVARVAAWPPEWWSVWWPRALRRPTDVWRRLPFVAKAVRVLITGSLVTLLALMLMRGRVLNEVNDFYEAWVETAEWSILVTTAVVVVLAFAWTKRKGLAPSQSLRLLLGPTVSSPGWKDPALLKLLAPASGRIREPIGDSPSEYLRAIRDLLPYVPLTPSGPGMRAVAAAESLLREIDRCDHDIAAVGRDAGPAEMNRLSMQLDALEVGTGDTDERKELLEVVRHQLEIVRRMQGRGEILRRQRAHFVDLLKEVWTVVREVGESRDGNPAGAGRLVALCAEIRLEVAHPDQVV